ncbi:MAG: Methionine aminopeptidase [uncultured bacterium]|nr:MAG: Methionine aminopeptidase [uncultured bacterium]
MQKINLKTAEEFKIMEEGGKILHEVKLVLREVSKIGVSATEIDKLAEKLILKAGAEPNFKKIKDYSWSTCISINEGVVHGIPHKGIVFKDGDLVSIDLGVLYKGFNTDTSISFGLNPSKEVEQFLKIGRQAFQNAVSAIVPNNSYIYDISKGMEEVLLKNGYSPILDLTGHGIGKKLHEEPYIPCFASGLRIESPKIVPGMALAVEVMYCMGEPNLVKENDGWTISTQDGKIAGLFEDTIIVTEKGFKIIT